MLPPSSSSPPDCSGRGTSHSFQPTSSTYARPAVVMDHRPAAACRRPGRRGQPRDRSRGACRRLHSRFVCARRRGFRRPRGAAAVVEAPLPGPRARDHRARRHHQVGASPLDRKSTRLNSSHSSISYAVFCLKKKKNPTVLFCCKKKKKKNKKEKKI